MNKKVRYELDLRERTVRVEEELKHQRELMMTGFSQMEKRFEQVDKQLEKQSQAIMDIHQEIKLQMRWSFGILVGVGGLVIGLVKVMA